MGKERDMKHKLIDSMIEIHCRGMVDKLMSDFADAELKNKKLLISIPTKK